MRRSAYRVCSQLPDVGPLGERDTGALAVGAAYVGNGHLLVRMVLADGGGDVPGVLDLVVANLHDHVAAPDAGVVRRRPGRDVLDDRAAVDVRADLALDLRCQVGGPDAEECWLPSRLDVVDDRLGVRDRDGEPDVLGRLAAGTRGHGGVDPDHASVGVDQRTARVAWVDRGVGLQHVLDRGADLAAGTRRPGDDPARNAEAALERERIPDRNDVVADLDLVGVVGADNREIAGVHLQDGDIRTGVAADDLRVEGAAVVELKLCRLRITHDVGVRDEVAVRRENEPRPRALALTRVDRDGRDRRLDLGDDAGDVVGRDRRARAPDLVRLGRGRRRGRRVVVPAEHEERARRDQGG